MNVSNFRISLRIIQFSCFMMMITNANHILNAEMPTESIEGLFYLDGTAIKVEIEDGFISKIIREDKLENSDVFIAPGLIDNQVNGYVGVDFSGEGLTVEGVRQVTQALLSEGVTTYLPTLITSTQERLLENFAILAEAIRDPEIGQCIPGFHLEGPYISSEDGYRGAHNKEWVRKPDWLEFLKLNKAADNKILQMTLAPEIEGAFDFIENCVRQGIVVAIGHHNASAELIKQVADAGVAISTHLGNGCANMIDRHVNPLWPQLAEDRLWASIIVDGFHLRPEEVQVFYKVKGPEKLVLVSDATMFAGMPPGEYTWNGNPIVMTPEGMIKYPAQNVLAGASFPIRKCVANMIKFTQCSLVDAIHMASRNPAILNGLHDRGEIKPGKRADLILFTVSEDGISIKKTVVAGKVVYGAYKD